MTNDENGQKTDLFPHKHLASDVNVLTGKLNMLPFLLKTPKTT